MDYTTIYRPLVYKDREDIDDFPVDETDNTDFLTMESVFMEKLEARRFIKDSFNASELILMIFNNARYITTLIYSENHPQHYLHKYLKIMLLQLEVMLKIIWQYWTEQINLT